MDRRTCLKTGAAALPLASGSLFASDSADPLPELLEVQPAPGSGRIFAADPNKPWPQTIRRIGQTNFTEHDPVSMDVEQWADYWHSLECDIVFVSGTGSSPLTRPKCLSPGRVSTWATTTSSGNASPRRRSVVWVWWRE